MEYCAPPPDPAADAAPYRHYHHYAAGYPAQHFHPAPPVEFDPSAEEHYANFAEGPNPNSFDDDVDSPTPTPPDDVPTEAREDALHRRHHVAPAASSHRGSLHPSSSSSVSEAEAEDPRAAEARGRMMNRLEGSDDVRTDDRTVFKKAPGAPKRFKSSYVHFFTRFVERKKQQLGPDGLPIKLDISSVSKECSQAWKTLPTEQRKYWDYVSEQEKREYMRQREAYRGPWRIATNKVKQKKDGAPKRSPSAFFLFVNARRPAVKAKHPDMANTEVVRKCSEMWKGASESEKAPFQEEEKKLRAQYHVEAESWKKGEKERRRAERGDEEKRAGRKRGRTNRAAEMSPSHEHAPHRHGYDARAHDPLWHAPPFAKSAGGRGKKRKRDPNAPKRSPPAFFLFVNHCRPDLKVRHPELRHTELVKMLGQRWSAMSEEEKRPFRGHEERLRRQYHSDVERYKKGAVPEGDYYATDPTSSHGAPEAAATNRPPRRADEKMPPRASHAMPHHHLEIHYQERHAAAGDQFRYRQHSKEEEDDLI